MSEAVPTEGALIKASKNYDLIVIDWDGNSGYAIEHREFKVHEFRGVNLSEMLKAQAQMEKDLDITEHNLLIADKKKSKGVVALH